MDYQTLTAIVKNELNMDIKNRHDGALLGVDCEKNGNFFVCRPGEHIFEMWTKPESKNCRMVREFETEGELVSYMFSVITTYPSGKILGDNFMSSLAAFKRKHGSEFGIGA